LNYSNSHLIPKIVCLGVFIAILVYLFHPAVGQLNLIINGEPETGTLAPLAALTTALLVLAITAVLGILIFFGVGLFLLSGAALIGGIGIILVAPYFWPMLFIIFLVIGVMTIGGHGKR
jgi:hypothetical protein